MGRLENIIARNRRPNHLRERVLVSLVLGSIVLLIIGLAVFTDLGTPPDLRNAGATSATPAGAPTGSTGSDDGKRVDGVLLRAMPAARPAPGGVR